MLKLGVSLPLLACLCACGPTSPAPAIEPASRPKPKAEPKSKAEPLAKPQLEPKPEPAEEMPTPPIPSAAMVEQILAQHVLDHPQVSPYLHAEVPDNLPLRVAPSPDLAQGAANLKVREQAVVVTKADEARFVFLGRERRGPAVERISFSIPSEGVRGHVDLELADHVWRAIDASVAEH